MSIGVFMRIALAAFVLVASLSTALAQTSTYTKLDLDDGCVFHSTYEAGSSAYCDGYRGYPVHFSEGDLRQMVRFGHLAELDGQWESFGQFNTVGNTIEWRLDDGSPYAAILRWFVSNSDDQGNATRQSEGQVLVISTVADHNRPSSCVVGYVDARANTDANQLARQVADDLARGFRCGEDEPVYHGAKGDRAGDPYRYFE